MQTQKKHWKEKYTVAGAKRFARHCLAKPCMNMTVYKYVPKLFLLARFGVRNNKNTEMYWSEIHRAEEDHHNPRFDNAVSLLLKRIDIKDKDVLDVGCARGVFLSTLTDARTRVGVDVSSSAVKIVQSKGIEAYCRALPNLDLQRQFDVVTCFETLEHVSSWKASVNALLDHVKHGGYLVLSVPFENGILISEHVTYFDLHRLYDYLRKKVTIIEIKIIGPWILVISQKKKYGRSEIYDAYPEFR